jgi:dTDP-4-dehydrorhamnose reductase
MGDMRTIALFGGGGFVGGNIAALARARGWRAVVVDPSFRPGLGDIEWRSVDIADVEQVGALLSELHADAAIDLAAIADVDKAERERDLAWKVNVEGARNIAEACAARGIKCVFFSSDAVFDGSRSGYVEEDPPAPVNFYGKTKAEAERAVLGACPGAVVVRISLVLGFPVTGGNSFYAGLAAKLAAGEEVACPTDELRTPIDVLTLSECALELAGSDYSGRLHLGATESINRYELARQSAALMGYDEGLVVMRSSQLGGAGRAPRHRLGVISVEKAGRVLETPMLGLEETIARAVGGHRGKGGRNDQT